MKDNKNVKFVQATKEVLKELGIEIKTTQIYEFYSKLLKEKNWNIAKSKKILLDNIIYENLSSTELVQNIMNLDHLKVIEEIHKRLGHSIKTQDDMLDSYGVGAIVDWQNPNVILKVAIMYRKEQSKNVNNMVVNNFFDVFSEKHIIKLRKAMNEYECSRGILYTNSNNIPYKYYKMAEENSIEIVDYEDMLKIAYQIDYKNQQKS